MFCELYRLNNSDSKNRLNRLGEKKVKDNNPDRGQHDCIDGRPSHADGTARRAEALVARDTANDHSEEERFDHAADHILGCDAVSNRCPEDVDVLVEYVPSHRATTNNAEDVGGDG